MSFWDASAIVSLLIEERGATRIKERISREDAMVVWWGSLIECTSALSRRDREGSLTPDQATQAWLDLERLQAGWSEVLPSETVRDLSLRLLRVHPLRAADSQQLAAALVWAQQRPRGRVFVCLDERLSEAAAREGFAVVP
jgi:uncharacterized protein